MKKTKVLFVCMCNICRSPTAQGIFEDLIEKRGLSDVIGVDSVGTHSYHKEQSPDSRAQVVLASYGIDISQQRARKIESTDIAENDYVLVMDQDNYHDLCRVCPDEYLNKIDLLMGFAPHLRVQEVPDPYSGGEEGFERAFTLIEAAVTGLIDEIQSKHQQLN